MMIHHTVYSTLDNKPPQGGSIIHYCYAIIISIGIGDKNFLMDDQDDDRNIGATSMNDKLYMNSIINNIILLV